MDYGDLLSSAWRVTWRHKYLWLLGLFAGGGTSFSFPGSAPDNLIDYQYSTGEVERFLNDYLGLILLLLALAAALFLVLVLVSVVATAGLIAGTDAAYRGAPLRGRDVWRQGLRFFWRFLGLWLVVIVGATLAALFVAGLVFAIVMYYATGDRSPGTAAIVFWVLLGLLGLLLVMVAAFVISIVMSWAERALVLEDSGVFASLGRGWRLFRSRPGASLLIWLLAAAISLAVGVAVGGAVLAAAIPTVLVGMATAGDDNPFLWALIPLAVLLALVAFGFLKAVTQTYFSAYWTIAYRKLTMPPPQIEPAAVPLVEG